MRQGQSQQNRNRSRGRGGRNKGGGHQPNRSLESNGPDIKIRGTAAHIAEKYATLARDALSSSDIVAPENYFQHAEHYNRLIASAQAAQTAQMAQREAARVDDPRNRPMAEDSDAGQISNVVEADGSESVGAADPMQGSGPQPVFDELPAEVAIKQTIGNQNANSNGADAKPEEKVTRRPRRAPRRPRKTAPEADNSDAPAEGAPELPAFIVGAGD